MMMLFTYSRIVTLASQLLLNPEKNTILRMQTPCFYLSHQVMSLFLR